jgi:Domain of unknown function (DUF4123)
MSDGRVDSTSPHGQPGRLMGLLFGPQAAGARPEVALYMLLDAARDPRIFGWLNEFGETIQQRSLYQGDVGDSLAHVSPYLLRVREDQPDSLRFPEAGFGQSWGLFVTSSGGFDDLRRHLRKFNIVYREDGTPLVFRFYDPRVLRVFLPTCTASELQRFFGPIDAFLVESEEGDALLRFTLSNGELARSRLPVQR